MENFYLFILVGILLIIQCILLGFKAYVDTKHTRLSEQAIKELEKLEKLLSKNHEQKS